MDKMDFGDSLAEILKLRNVKVDEFAEAIGVSYSTVYEWMRGEHGIKLSNLVRAANYLKCSVPYLIGESADDSVAPERRYPNFGLHIREVMKEYGKTTYDLRKKKYGGKHLRDWKNGVQPSLSTLIAISEIIGCNVDHLIGYEK